MHRWAVLLAPLVIVAAAWGQTVPATGPTGVSATAPATAPALLPIPDEHAQDHSRLMIVNLFKEDFAKVDAAGRQALAKELVAQAGTTKDDATARYVLLQEGLELAAIAGDPETAFTAATELQRWYKVDGIDLKKRALFRSNVMTDAPVPSEAVARHALDTADEAARLDQFDSVQQLVNLTESAANKTRKVAFVTSIQTRLFDLRSLIADFPKVQKDLDRLAADTSDEQAQLFVGRFYALRKGQWVIGLPHLAAGSDAALRQLATRDLAKPTEGLVQAQLGDDWWDYAQKATGSVRAHVEDRARDWYRLARPNLAGLTLTRIQARMQAGGATSQTATTSTGGEVANLLALVDVSKDVVDGKWAFANGAMQCVAASRNALIALPYLPPEEYDLRIEFMRTEGEGPVTILLAARGKYFGFALDVKGEGRFERVAGKIAKDNPTAAPVVVNNNHRYVLTLQVHKDVMRALLDDRLITQWKTDYKDVGRYAIWKMPDEKLCGIGVGNSKAVIYSIEMMELAGKGRPSR